MSISVSTVSLPYGDERGPVDGADLAKCSAAHPQCLEPMIESLLSFELVAKCGLS